MLQFNQMNHSFARPEAREEEKLTLVSCQRRASEFEKRFCFDLTFKEKPGIVYTFQALSEEDRRAWINAMDGTEPVMSIFHISTAIETLTYHNIFSYRHI